MSETLSSRLKNARVKKGMTQIQVMQQTNINHKTLSGYENNVSEPDLNTLKVLAQLYGVTTDFLLGRTDIPTAATPESIFDRDNEPTEVELEQILRNSRVNFDGAPLDDEDKEDIINFLKMAWNTLRKKKKD
ncbi:helix-turn-helix transcriptional regulator [Paradesulfitobacterium aromaticivorans]